MVLFIQILVAIILLGVVGFFSLVFLMEFIEAGKRRDAHNKKYAHLIRKPGG